MPGEGVSATRCRPDADDLCASHLDDTEKKFTVSGIEDETLLDTWLFFQASGQGPYFGQAAHFKMFAPEKVSSMWYFFRERFVYY